MIIVSQGHSAELSSSFYRAMGEEAPTATEGPGSWPEKGKLARLWEESSLIRETVRAHGKLFLWPSAKHSGVVSKVSLRLNRFVIQRLLEIWVPYSSGPKSPPIGWIREEAGESSLSLRKGCSSCSS